MRSAVLILWLLGSSQLMAELRKWTSSDGRVIEAEFVRQQKGAVTLKMKDGREVPVELAKLSRSGWAPIKPRWRSSGNASNRSARKGRKCSGISMSAGDFEYRRSQTDATT